MFEAPLDLGKALQQTRRKSVRCGSPEIHRKSEAINEKKFNIWIAEDLNELRRLQNFEDTARKFLDVVAPLVKELLNQATLLKKMHKARA
eukprot:13028561-Alexandrium_andersonii.AAC.1